MTDQHTHPADTPEDYSTLEILGRRADGTATALRPDATSPVLLDGNWWAIRRDDPTGRYRPVRQPRVVAYYDDLASRSIATSIALADLDSDDDSVIRDQRQVQR